MHIRNRTLNHLLIMPPYHKILSVSFPFLNINAVFVVFAVGADDIFVAVDKWKMMRRELPHDFRTEQVAEHALPKIAFATFVTSITTAAAFFASAGNNVPIVSSLAIFSGLVITMDYVLSIVILFPSICIYDRWLVRGCRSRWISLRSEEKWISSNIPKDKHPRNGAESEACRESEATSEASAIIGGEYILGLFSVFLTIIPTYRNVLLQRSQKSRTTS